MARLDQDATGGRGMTLHPCPLERCAQTITRPATICPGCIARLRLDLRDVPRALAELDETSAGLGSTWREPGSRGGSTDRIPVSDRTMDARLALVTVLHDWVRVWDEEHPTPDTWPEGPICPWLPCGHLSCHEAGIGPTRRPLRDQELSSTAGQAAMLRRVLTGDEEWAPDLARELRDALAEVRQIGDRPPDLAVVGRCPCGTPLYAPEGRGYVQCRGCGTIHDAGDARAASLAAVGQLLPAADLALALGMDDGGALIRQWKRRGKICPVSRDIRGRSLYRVADAQALHAPQEAPA
jgi:hypothetical protein